MKIKEFSLTKNQDNIPRLEVGKYFNWKGEPRYFDEIHRMLNELFKLNKQMVEKSYVIAFDHAKEILGIMQVGQGSTNETPMPFQSIFTFLMLVGATSFMIIHNHISNMPNPSMNDRIITNRADTLGKMFEIAFIGHMIVNPKGYVVDEEKSVGLVNELDKEITDEVFGAEFELEDLGNGMAATYVFGNRIEGKMEDIKTIVGIE